jgi:hypothetical protein
MNRQQRPITDREFKAWLAAGAVDRGVGEGLTFVASTTAAQAGKASWILRYRLNTRSKEKVLPGCWLIWTAFSLNSMP